MKLKSRYAPWILLPCFLPALVAAPAETAWQALDVLKSERGSVAISRVTQIRGHRGQDQPEVWEIVTRMADGERVFVTRGGEIVADTIYTSGGGVTIDTRRLRIDSHDAFRIANSAAATSKIGFDTIDYELRAAAGGNSPLWVIYLRDTKGNDVGELKISGEDGKVLRQTWFAARAGEREPIGKEESSAQQAMRSYPAEGRGGMFARTTSGLEGSGERVKKGFRSIGSSFSKIFKGEAVYHVRPDARYQRPGTVKRVGRR